MHMARRAAAWVAWAAWTCNTRRCGRSLHWLVAVLKRERASARSFFGENSNEPKELMAMGGSLR